MVWPPWLYSTPVESKYSNISTVVPKLKSGMTTRCGHCSGRLSCQADAILKELLKALLLNWRGPIRRITMYSVISLSLALQASRYGRGYEMESQPIKERLPA